MQTAGLVTDKGHKRRYERREKNRTALIPPRVLCAVLMFAAACAGDAGRVFDVFDREGRFLGRARREVAFQAFPALPALSNGFMYGVTSDPAGF